MPDSSVQLMVMRKYIAGIYCLGLSGHHVLVWRVADTDSLY